MKDLFSMDKHDYDPEGKVFSRPSARAIVIRDGKVLLMYSPKYDYYKFPGGGIEKDEDNIAALIREVREESGYQVLAETVEEFGRVLRKQKDSYDEKCIFQQENFYYFCDVKDQIVSVELDDYEAEEGFTPVWMDAFAASKHNAYCHTEGVDREMVKRESKVLDLVDLEQRRRERKKREAEAVRDMGDQDYAGMLAYVGDVLQVNTESGEAKSTIEYSRFDHTKRVLGWAIRLYQAAEDKEQLRYEDIMIATIFHDVGRVEGDRNGIPHAKAGVPITEAYLREHGFEKERIDYICKLVEGHSDKWRMGKEEVDPGLLLLMEADLLDDMGAQGVVMDCMITQKRETRADFADCMDHIDRYTLRIQRENPCVTAAGRRFWEEKTVLVEQFTQALHRDLEMFR